MNEIIDAGASAESVDGDVFEHADGPPPIKTSGGDIELDARGRLALYLAVGLAAVHSNALRSFRKKRPRARAAL